MSSRSFILLSTSFALLMSSGAVALNPAQTLSEYKHVSWKIGDAGLAGRPYAVAQSGDGYVWVGTSAGLFRFDGMAFSPWRRDADHRPFSDAVYELFPSRDGALWFSGSFRGVIRLDGWAAQSVGQEGPPESTFITQDEDGVVWYVTHDAAHDRYNLCNVDGHSRPRCVYSTAAAIFSPCMHAGAIWFGTATGLVRFQQGSAKDLPITGLQSSSGQQGVTSIIPDGEGNLFIGIARRGPGLGLERLVADKLVPVTARGFDGSELKVLSLYRDSHGALWIGTDNQGIYRLYQDRVERFAVPDGLSGNAIWYMREDHEGSLWVQTLDGLDRFSDRPVVTVKDENGFHAMAVDGVTSSRDGTLWVSGDETLITLNPITHQFGQPVPQPLHALVTSIFEDHSGTMWIGLDDSLNRFVGNRFIPVNGPDGKSLGMILALAEDGNGNLWAASRGPPRRILKIDSATLEVSILSDLPPASRVAADGAGGIYIAALSGTITHVAASGAQSQVLPPAGRSGKISHLTLAKDGILLASTPFGLMTVIEDRSRVLSSQNGLPCDQVFDAVLDEGQNIWLYMRCGIARISTGDFARWLVNSSATLSTIHLDAEDGAIPLDTSFGGSARTPDGRLWFAGAVRLQTVDPDAVVQSKSPPPIHIESFTANKTQYALDRNITLPSLTRDLQIAYAGLSYMAPDRVEFRYKLEGFDRDWQYVVGRHEAVYTTLPPGQYHFRVAARTRQSAWNEEDASLEFELLPALGQTLSFRILCALVIFGAIWLIFQLRIKQVAAQVRLRESVRHAERERIARRLHDTFLQSVQGLVLRFGSAAKKVPAELPARGILEDLLRRSDAVIAEARGSIQELREHERRSLNLSQEISVLADRIAIDSHLAVTVLPRGIPFELTSDVFENAVLIAQEAMLNVAKHASAQKMEVEIGYLQREFRLSVRDDGAGMEDTLVRKGRQGHWGLLGMRERASAIRGNLRILSRPGLGTEIELSVPRSFATVSDTPGGAGRLRGVARRLFALLQNYWLRLRGPRS